MMKRSLLICLLLLVPFFGTSQPAEKACFSVPGGFYEDSFLLELYPYYQQHHIRFTTNGNRPTATSRLYTEPLLLDESLYSTSDIYTIQTAPDHLFFQPNSVEHCIVIRAAVFDANENCISEVVTNSYFIHSLGCDTHSLPVVSICADSLDLFDFQNGILVPGVHFDPNAPNWSGNYYQSGDEWERLANVEFYELDDNTGVNQLAGLRTHGGNARRCSQKGMKVYAREEYGTKRFQHAFFKSIPHNSFKHLVLKPFADQWFWAGTQNMICQMMARDVNVEVLAVRPSVLYLNGEYWGIYSVCEKPDSHYLEDHLGFGDQEFNVIGNWYGLTESGSNAAFMQMISWLEDNDLSDDQNYHHLCSLVDMDCFIDYYCLELFTANSDWPANNMRCYQLHNDGKWRWIFYDGDNCLREMDFDVMENATSTLNPGWPNNLASTLMFRKLLKNNAFVLRFLSRFRQLMADQFTYEHTHPYFNACTSLVRDEVANQSARFNMPQSVAQWERLVEAQDDFLRLRVDDMTQKLNSFLSIEVNDSIQLFSCAPNPSSGSVTLSIGTENASELEFQVYDIMGRQVFAKRLALNEGVNTISLDLPLASGLYFLKINQRTVKIILQ